MNALAINDIRDVDKDNPERVRRKTARRGDRQHCHDRDQRAKTEPGIRDIFNLLRVLPVEQTEHKHRCRTTDQNIQHEIYNEQLTATARTEFRSPKGIRKAAVSPEDRLESPGCRPHQRNNTVENSRRVFEVLVHKNVEHGREEQIVDDEQGTVRRRIGLRKHKAEEAVRQQRERQHDEVIRDELEQVVVSGARRHMQRHEEHAGQEGKGDVQSAVQQVHQRHFPTVDRHREPCVQVPPGVEHLKFPNRNEQRQNDPRIHHGINRYDARTDLSQI